jgi:ankyrin repeat protein
MVRGLLSSQADVNCPNKDGNTPLHEATRIDNSEILSTLTLSLAAV